MRAAGYRSDLPTVLHALSYVTVQELATCQAHRNVGVMCGAPVGEQLMARIAADESLHMLFCRDLYADALRVFPDDALTALTDVICDFRMPGTTIPGFRARALRVAVAGIFDLDVHHQHVVRPLLRALGVMCLCPASARPASRPRSDWGSTWSHCGRRRPARENCTSG
ncbi:MULTISPECIES: acyl-ACP desaturase [unclassified Streptomyces]|uniref:acyl-ACP desaturase n=1 Tax=unclassified Streptomyces TaxID=2593676 RepID=UPI00039A0DD3|nr:MULTISPECIES: acyl-ACP desaturase [unclassified Streptomyces]